MKTKYILSVLLIVLCFSFLKASPQNTNTKNNIERVYLHTDKPLYFPGETVWFKAYIVSEDNRITNISDIVYIDLISPKGDILSTQKLRISEGATYGDFVISNDMPGGMYSVRAYTKWMKNFDLSIYFSRKLQVQKIVKPKLLMKLDFEKKSYGKKSNVVANFELKNLKNEALKDTEFEYIVNISGEKHLSGKIITDTEGKADVKFTLPETLTTSDVLLNLLISYHGNVETITRSVPVTLDNIDLQFFPEGGYLLENTENKVAFKAINEFGKPADLTAIIVDEKGTILKYIESFHDGMGAFDFIPETGKKYFARITKPFESKLLYELPECNKHGHLLSLIKNDSVEIVLNIYSTQQSEVYLRAKTAAVTHFKNKLQIDSGWNEISFSPENLPIGIVEFTLINEEMVTQVERLVFVNKNKDLKISVKTNKSIYSPREKVEIKITTTDSKGIPIPSNLSLSVADNKILSFADDKQDNMLSYLLMSSLLKGKIHEPNFYFDPEEEKAEKAIDLLMLTHGWRSYFFSHKINFSNAEFQAEKFNVESRTVVNSKDEPVKATVLVIEQYHQQKIAKIETDETGYFAFKKEAGKTYFVMAYSKDKKEVFIKKDFKPKEKIKSDNTIVPDIINKDESEGEKEDKNKDNSKQKLDKNINDAKIELKTKKIIHKREKNVDFGNNTSTNNESILMESSTDLEECIVTALGIAKGKKSLGYAATYVNSDLITSTNIINALQGKVAGVVVTSGSGTPGASSRVVIRGANSFSASSQPLYVIDGVPVSTGLNNESISSLNPDDIQSIQVYKGNSATSLFGSSASNGVIVIKTNRANNFNNAKHFRVKKKIKYAHEIVMYNRNENYSSSRQFYVPVYDSKDPISIRNDFRQTIYWNPVIQTNEKGKANISFYNSDAITSFKIVTEGIGFNGLVGRDEQTYSIQKPLSIDVKIPSYMSIGDTVKIPVIISNNTDKELSTIIALNFPKEIKLISVIPDSLIVPKKGGISKFVKVVPVQEVSNTKLIVGIESDNFKDLFTQEVEILSPLFPKSVSFSGYKNETYLFDFNDKIAPNTLNSDLTVYIDIIGDVMNGIESIMREPSGCFEQVSATAYPNVMVMKYLKESGKSNPDIERRAMGYIKNGYRQLAAYETKENGFEWYGGTPPHEVLSAYGIMQFTEMKEIYSSVDEEMIQRTIDWLMTRKNGNGGFKQNRGRYGFSAGPVKVNNAYIVYALSESGIDAPFEFEYQTAYEEALKSEDNYRLALMASASFNLSNQDNYNKIIDLLINKINWKNLNSINTENSITYSYGNSLKVETASLIALALLKNIDNLDYAQKCINFILENRSYNRFGNTQATSLALKALIEFTKLKRNSMFSENENFLVLSINGNDMKVKLEQNEKGLLQIKGIEKHLSSGKQKIDIRFSDPKITFPYSLNINWKTPLPGDNVLCPLKIETKLKKDDVRLGETVRMNIKLENKLSKGVPMSIAKIGIPSGLSVRIKQLEELKEKKQFAYYEIMKNYVVFYWRELGPNEIKTINLDLTAEVKGKYTAAAGSAYLYYSDENKDWIKGTEVNIW